MATEVRDLAERKRQLLYESERLRRVLGEDVQELRTATEWLPRTVRAARAVYPAWLLAGPVLGYVFGRKLPRPHYTEPSQGRIGLFGKALAGYKLFRKVKPFWDGMRSRKS